MTDHSPRPAGVQTDRLAVLGVALAAAVSVTAAEGAWDVLDFVVGLVLLVLLFCYYPWNERADVRSLVAVATVTGLCVLLVVTPVLSYADLLSSSSTVVLLTWLAATSFASNVLLTFRLRRGK